MENNSNQTQVSTVVLQPTSISEADFTRPAPPPSVVSTTSTLSTVMHDDMGHYNRMLQGLHQSWDEAVDPDLQCRLALTTIKVLEHRRKSLLFPFGTQTQQQKSDDGYGAFDD